MHIGFLTFESPFGAKGCGVASYLRAMIPALLSGGHSVTLITAAGRCDDIPNPYGEALRILRVKLPNAHWYVSKLPFAGNLLTLPLRELEWSFEFRRSLEKAMREHSMDVLEVTELGTWCVARDPIVPLVARLHGSEYTFRRYSGEPATRGSAWSRSLQRAALNHAAAVTSPSRFHADEVTREMEWPAEYVDVVPNVVAREVLEAAEASASASEESREQSREPSHEQSKDAPLILYTGRLAPVKGTKVLMEAAVEVLKDFPRAQFVLAGPWQMPFPAGDWPAWLERMGGSQGIRWVGYQNQEQLAELYRRTAVFVMPSFYETFGISCLEAMAFRIPVVATRAGALPEVIEDQRVGLTVTPGEPAALADAIRRLLRDPSLRHRLGAAGRERVLAHYTPEAARDGMLAAYQRACERPN